MLRPVYVGECKLVVQKTCRSRQSYGLSTPLWCGDDTSTMIDTWSGVARGNRVVNGRHSHVKVLSGIVSESRSIVVPGMGTSLVAVQNVSLLL